MESIPSYANGSKTTKAAFLSVLSVITAKTARNVKKGVRTPGQYVNIPRTKLQSIAANYRQIIKELACAGIVEVNDHYKTKQAGQKGFCKSYRLAKVHRKSEVLTLVDENPRKRRKDAVKDTSFCQNETEAWLAANIRSYTIDEAKLARVLKSVEGTKKKAIVDCAAKFRAHVANLRKGRAVNRIYSLMTSAPRQLRGCLLLDGKPLVEIDVKSCQPALLITLCPENEKAAFADLLGKDFYSLSKSGRDKAKKEFGQFAFGKYRRKNSLGEAIRAQFPGLFGAVRSFDGSLARHLQNLEAEICIGRVVPRLMAEGIHATTAHDAFFVRPADAQRAQEIVKEEFSAALGFEVSVNIKE